MEQAIGTVVSIDKTYAKIKLDRKSMCGDNCASCGGMCGIRNTIIRAKNTVNALVGDTVLVQIPTNKGILAMFLTYGIPLIYMVVMAVFMAIFLTERQGIILIALGLCAWALILYISEKKGKFLSSFNTEIINIIKENKN